MICPGLVSITFRDKSAEEVVALVKQAGLQAIEWGGDIHVPHGDLHKAAQVQEITAAAGLKVASYGSYYRVAKKGQVPFKKILQTAVALGAPSIRVWAGEHGSAESSTVYRHAVVAESRALAEQAQDVGLHVAYEFHRNTFTDTTEAAAHLLEEVNHPNIWTYWQPPVAWTSEACRMSIESLLSHLLNMHVFAWDNQANRMPLRQQRDVWRQYLGLLQKRSGGEQHFAMIEFVKNDEAEQFLDDAAVLNAIVAELGD